MAKRERYRLRSRDRRNSICSAPPMPTRMAPATLACASCVPLCRWSSRGATTIWCSSLSCCAICRPERRTGTLMSGRQKKMLRTYGQRGMALVFTLCLLLLILLLGVSAAQMALLGEKAARGERDRHIAFHAAEEALMDAERDIEGQPGAPGRSAMFASDSAAGFAAGCGEQAGLCLPASASAPPVWLAMDLDEDAGGAVSYGSFTGAVMQ